MSRFNQVVLISLLLLLTGMMAGCTKKPGTGTAAAAPKLEEVRMAVESAEHKLGELRLERIKLEKELQAKQAEPQKKE